MGYWHCCSSFVVATAVAVGVVVGAAADAAPTSNSGVADPARGTDVAAAGRQLADRGSTFLSQPLDTPTPMNTINTVAHTR